MLSRWFEAAHYCAILMKKEIFIAIIHIFLVPAAIVVNPLSPRLAYFLLRPKCRLRNVLVSILCLVPLLPLYVLILAVSLLWMFCFIAWYFSVLVFGSRFVRRLRNFDKKYALPSNDELLTYLSVVDLPGFDEENYRKIFWMVNKKSFDRIEGSMNKDNTIEERFPGLFSIMGNHKVSLNQRLWPTQQSWIATITRICSGIAHLEIGLDMVDATFRETKEMLMFVDCPDNIVVDPLNVFGTVNFRVCAQSIICEGDMGKVIRKLKQDSDKSHEERVLRSEERMRINNQLRQFKELLEQSDETVYNSLLIRLGECSYSNMEELSEMLHTLVGHVIVSALLEARDVLLKYTKQWAHEMDERKIEKAIEHAGMVSALLENLVDDGDHILFTTF